MISLWRWLFRIWGLLPNGSKSDIYFASLVFIVELCGFYILWLHTWAVNITICEKYCFTSLYVVFCMAGLLFIAQVNKSKKEFISLVNNCLETTDADERNLKLLKRFQLLVFLAFFLTFAIRAGLRLSYNQSFTTVFVYEYGIAVIYGPHLMELLMVRHLQCRFNYLNDRLIDVLQASNDLGTDLEVLFRKHALLRDLKDKINSQFGIFTAVIFGVHALYGTFHMYEELIKLVYEDKNVRWLHLITFSTGFGFIVTIADGCDKCSQKVKETLSIIMKSVNKNIPIKILDQIDYFALTMFDNPESFSAGGLFELNRALITKVTMAIATCLIISIQLTQLGDLETTTTNTIDYNV